MRIVICGLSITSSWGNGHATTYRALVRELAEQGHDILFLERDQKWYADNRDLPKPNFCELGLYGSVEEFKDRFTEELITADVVIVGSFVPNGIEIGEYVVKTSSGLTAFYDIDTPVTIARLNEKFKNHYINRELISRYHLYLSFTGGPILRQIERFYKSPRARVLYCSVDTRNYFPEEKSKVWELGYLGTYSVDRQPTLNEFLIEPAGKLSDRKFVIGGAQYPDTSRWPQNVVHIPHLAPYEHRGFYNSQKYTLNVTRQDMIRAGYSPSVRLFEAAACGTPVISDNWPGLDELFKPGEEILISKNKDEVLSILDGMSEDQRISIGERARKRVLANHTAAHRAAELEQYLFESLEEKTRGFMACK
jgi:spore maturation protein CgeB